jgi:hypothetical protein
VRAMFELFRPKAPKPLIRSVNVYLAREGEAAIVARTDDWDGAWIERPGGAERLTAPSLSELGDAVKRAFAEFGHREGPIDLRGHKPTDWPAFQASGLKTLKAFERGFVTYSVKGVNPANIDMAVESPPLSNDIALKARISAFAKDEEVGRWLRDFHTFFLSIERSMGSRTP